MFPSISERHWIHAQMIFRLLHTENKVDKDSDKESGTDEKRANERIYILAIAIPQLTK